MSGLIVATNLYQACCAGALRPDPACSAASCPASSAAGFPLLDRLPEPPQIAAAARCSRAEPVQITRKHRNLPDIGRAGQPGRPAFQPDRETAVRRHPVLEHLEVSGVGPRVLASAPRAASAAR